MKRIKLKNIFICIMFSMSMLSSVSASDIHTLIIGKVSPNQNKLDYQILKKRVENIANKMKEQGIKNSDVFLAKTIPEMSAAIKSGKVNWLSDTLLTSLTLATEIRAEVFISQKGNIERYTSVFFVNKKSNINSLEGMEKKIVLFEQNKTSNGYFIPFYELTNHDYIPKEYAKTDTTISAGKKRIYFRFEKNKTELVKAVKNNTLNIGVLSGRDYKKISAIYKSDLKIIYETVAYPSVLELITPDQDLKIKNKLRSLLKINLKSNALKDTYSKLSDRRFERFLADGKDGYVYFKNIIKHNVVPFVLDENK